MRAVSVITRRRDGCDKACSLFWSEAVHQHVDWTWAKCFCQFSEFSWFAYYEKVILNSILGLFIFYLIVEYNQKYTQKCSSQYWHWLHTWCYRNAWNRLFQRITTILPWPVQDILSEAVTLRSKQRSLEKWDTERAPERNTRYFKSSERHRVESESKKQRWGREKGKRDDINRDREWLKVDCSAALALGLASVLESLFHPQWHVVSRPLPHTL